MKIFILLAVLVANTANVILGADVAQKDDVEESVADALLMLRNSPIRNRSVQAGAGSGSVAAIVFPADGSKAIAESAARIAVGTGSDSTSRLKKKNRNHFCSLCNVITGPVVKHGSQKKHQSIVYEKIDYLNTRRKINSTLSDGLLVNVRIEKDQAKKFTCTDCKKTCFLCYCFVELYSTVHIAKMHALSNIEFDTGYYLCDDCYNQQTSDKDNSVACAAVGSSWEWSDGPLIEINVDKGACAGADSGYGSGSGAGVAVSNGVAHIDLTTEGEKNGKESEKGHGEKRKKPSENGSGSGAAQVDDEPASKKARVEEQFDFKKSLSEALFKSTDIKFIGNILKQAKNGEVEEFIAENFEKLALIEFHYLWQAGLKLEKYLIDLCFEKNCPEKLRYILDFLICCNIASDQKIKYLEGLLGAGHDELLKVVQDKIDMLKSGVAAMNTEGDI